MRLTVVTPYGAEGASTRVRAYDWLRHLGRDADRHEYLGTASSGARTLSRRPAEVLRAERSLRDLAERGSDVLLLQR